MNITSFQFLLLCRKSYTEDPIFKYWVDIQKHENKNYACIGIPDGCPVLGKSLIYKKDVEGINPFLSACEEGNYEDDVVTDDDRNQTITKKATDKIIYSEKKIFDKEIADYAERKRNLSRNLEITYSVI